MLPMIIRIFILFMLAFYAYGEKFNSGDVIFSNAIENYFEPIIVSEILGPHIPENISKNYKADAYRNAVVDLRRLKELQLPDGRLDSYIFMLGECYRKLELPQLALEQYSELIDYFPNSKWRPYSIFRKAQISDREKNDSLVEVNFKLIEKSYPRHVLSFASGYLYGKSLINQGKYQAALGILEKTSVQSEYYLSSIFLRAYAYYQTKQWDKALFLLSKIYEQAKNQDLIDEARLLEGSIWVGKSDTQRALDVYSQINEKSKLFPLASLKAAQIHYEEKNFEMVQKLAKPVLKEEAYYFEASLVLMDSYWKQKDSLNANIIRNQLSQNTQFTRMLIVIEEEKTLLAELDKKIYSFSKYENEYKDIPDIQARFRGKTKSLNQKLDNVQKSLKEFALVKEGIQVVGLKEKKLFDYYSQELEQLNSQIEGFKESVVNLPYESPASIMDSLHSKLDNMESEKTKVEFLVNEIYDLIDLLSYKNKKLSLVQPKFIDVGLIMYQNLKRNYQESAKRYREYVNALSKLQQEPAAQ